MVVIACTSGRLIFPSVDQVKNQRDQNTENNAGPPRKIEPEIFALNGNVARKFPKKGILSL